MHNSLKRRIFRQKFFNMNIDSEKIAKYVKYLREQEKITQNEIALKLNMTQQNYLTKEKSKNGINIDFINDVAKVFKKTGLQLINEAHNYSPSSNIAIKKVIDDLRKDFENLANEKINNLK